jgi:effector-binding domain-containing protein
MKALRIIGIILVSIILIVVVVGYIQPDVAKVERSTIVKAPIEVVFEQANNLEKRVNWSPWEKVDSTMTTEMGEITSGEGASYTWTSETQGTGTLTYTEVVPNEKLMSHLNFGPKGKANGIMTFKEAQDGVKVTWGFETESISNPFGRLAMAILTPQMEMMFDQGLEALKSQAESSTESQLNTTEIVETTVESFRFISVMDSASSKDMSDHYAKAYGKLGQFAGENQLEIVGQPISINHSWDEETQFGVFEPAMPIAGDAEGTDEIMVKESYAGKTLKAIHTGSYETMNVSWEALMKKVYSEGYEMNGLPWEVYVTDPGQEPDSTKWITEIYMPIK